MYTAKFRLPQTASQALGMNGMGGVATQYQDQLARLQAFSHIMQHCLPATLVAQCHATLVRDETGALTPSILAANNAQATKLRQFLPRLLTETQKRGWKVSAIRIKVQASGLASDAPEPQIKRATLSDTARGQIGTWAANLSDSPAREAARLFAKRLEKN